MSRPLRGVKVLYRDPRPCGVGGRALTPRSMPKLDIGCSSALELHPCPAASALPSCFAFAAWGGRKTGSLTFESNRHCCCRPQLARTAAAMPGTVILGGVPVTRPPRTAGE